MFFRKFSRKKTVDNHARGCAILRIWMKDKVGKPGHVSLQLCYNELEKEDVYISVNSERGTRPSYSSRSGQKIHWEENLYTDIRIYGDPKKEKNKEYIKEYVLNGLNLDIIKKFYFDCKYDENIMLSMWSGIPVIKKSKTFNCCTFTLFLLRKGGSCEHVPKSTERHVKAMVVTGAIFAVMAGVFFIIRNKICSQGKKEIFTTLCNGLANDTLDEASEEADNLVQKYSWRVFLSVISLTPFSLLGRKVGSDVALVPVTPGDLKRFAEIVGIELPRAQNDVEQNQEIPSQQKLCIKKSGMD